MQGKRGYDSLVAIEIRNLSGIDQKDADGIVTKLLAIVRLFHRRNTPAKDVARAILLDFNPNE